MFDNLNNQPTTCNEMVQKHICKKGLDEIKNPKIFQHELNMIHKHE